MPCLIGIYFTRKVRMSSDAGISRKCNLFENTLISYMRKTFCYRIERKKNIKNKIRTNYGKLCLFSCNYDVSLVVCSHMHGSISLREIPQARNLKKTTNILCRLFILDFKNFHDHHPVLYYQSKQYHLQYANKYREKTSFFIRFSKFEFVCLNCNF